MRSDWPVVPEEDCIEPPCEIFLQLFIQNVETLPVSDTEMEDNDDYDFLFGNGEESYEQDADELIQDFGPILIEDEYLTDVSDDSIALSMPHSPITYPVSSDEMESETESYCEESNNDAHCSQNSLSGMSEHSEEESFLQIVSSDDSNDSGQQEPNLFDESEEIRMSPPLYAIGDSTSSDLIHGSEELSLTTDLNPRGESRCLDLIDGVEEVPFVTDLDRRKQLPRCSEASLNTDAESRSENSEVAGHSNIVDEECEKYCDLISSKEVTLPSRLSYFEESSAEFEPPTTNSNLKHSTHVSLYVVIPPTSFSNEGSSNLSGAAAINPVYPSSLASDSGKFQLDNLPIQNSIKSPNSSEEFASSCMSTMSDISITENKESDLSDTYFILDDSSSDSNGENISLDDSHSEIAVFDTTLTEGSSNLEKNESSEISDKCISSLKRKVSSVDNAILNKVPKYSCQTPNDSANQASLDYCKVLSNNSESIVQTSHETEKIDIVPPTVASDNVILTLGKSVEQTSVVNQKPKSR